MWLVAASTRVVLTCKVTPPPAGAWLVFNAPGAAAGPPLVLVVEPATLATVVVVAAVIVAVPGWPEVVTLGRADAVVSVL
mmetsp:Transcript_73354/g.170164  ORF Transcript_73354/g.170164 Transcript_73354/m.170164 type:complete len:80 (-) Transcript_73354:187-426(-)